MVEFHPRRWIVGIIVILIGVALLLSTTGMVEAESIWVWLPLPFVLLGIWAFLRSKFRNLVGPGMVVAIAGTYQLRNLGLIADETIATWWPLFVVLFGLLLILSRIRRERLRYTHTGAEPMVVSVFGSDRQRVDTDRFTGGELIAIFGDSRLDLRSTTPPASPALVDVTSIFGDVELLIPADWTVKLDVFAIFGDVHDMRSGSPTDGTQPDVVISGMALFGDVEIRD